jgi:hypothetical protein
LAKYEISKEATNASVCEFILIYVRGWVDPTTIRVAGRIRSIAKSNDLTGTRTRDLPACSIMHQPPKLLRGP